MALQSISGWTRLPPWNAATALRATLLVALLLPVSAYAQNGKRTIAADTDFLKEMGGPTVLARLRKGGTVTVTRTRNGWAEVTVEGWLASGSQREEKRDGFDVMVTPNTGTPLRAGAGSGATIATAKAGALFDRVSVKGQWVQVKRSGWMAADRLQANGSVATNKATPPPPPPAQRTKPETTTAPTTVTGPPSQGMAPQTRTLVGGAALFDQASGTRVGTFETPFSAKLIERRDGWSRVQVELWVRDEALGDARSTGGITAAALRADPDKYTGQTVEWTLQVLALQKADALRPEIPLGQPYVLARGPLPEVGLVYLVISPADVSRFTSMEPLATIQVQATIRAGRARHLPTPVLDFVRRIN